MHRKLDWENTWNNFNEIKMVFVPLLGKDYFLSLCSKQLDKHEQSRNNRPRCKGLAGWRAYHLPINKQNYKPLHDHSLKLYTIEMTSRPQLCFNSRPREAAKLDRAMSWLTSSPAALTNDLCHPISGDHERAYLGSW